MSMSSAGGDDVAIRVEHVSKSHVLYDRPFDRLKQLLLRRPTLGSRVFHALKGVDFELRRGEALGIIGKNGAGKSTLLQLICGTLAPTSGRIITNGRIAALLELGAGFNPEFTGRENVFMNAALLGVDDALVRERFAEIVAFSGIGDFIDQPVKTYSSGMFVRLAFSVATAFEPDILVIDEALSVGDGAFARKSFDRIMQLRDKGATILFCSHAMYHVDALCGRALWLDRGEVRLLDAAHKVTAAYNNFLAAETTESKPNAAAATTPMPTVAPGTGRIHDVQARCGRQTGQHLALVSRESDVEVEVVFELDPALPNPRMAMGIETDAGFGVASAISPGQIRRDPTGKGCVRLSLPAAPLLKGRYHLTLFLTCEHVLHVYDQAWRCVTLDVSQNDNLQGVVALPNLWEGEFA